MTTVKNWTAKRAGGRITIHGQGLDGKDVRITNVDKIEAGDPHSTAERSHIAATDKNGAEHILLIP